jgi:shikimate kinase
MVDELKIDSIANRLEFNIFSEPEVLKKIVKDLDEDEKVSLIFCLTEKLLEKNGDISKYRNIADAVRVLKDW